MENYTAEMIKDMAFSFCPQCGTAIVTNHKGRPRKFCSPECRSRWNNTHPKPENWRTVRSKICPVSVLKPAAYNPRKKLKPGDKEYEKIKNSITEFGFADPLVVNADMTIIGGHQRLTVAMELG